MWRSEALKALSKKSTDVLRRLRTPVPEEQLFNHSECQQKSPISLGGILPEEWLFCDQCAGRGCPNRDHPRT